MIDTERYYFETERIIAKEFGREVEDTTLWKMMGRSPLDALTIFAKDLGINTSPEELLKKRNIMMEERMKNNLIPLPGLFDIIDEFFGILKLAIATGSQKAFLDITVDSLDIREKFTVLQSSDEIKHGKPNPEIYLTTINKLNLLPKECIILEDSSNGSLAGKKAGSSVIAIPSEYTKDQDFSFVDFIAKDLFEAKEYINELTKYSVKI